MVIIRTALSTSISQDLAQPSSGGSSRLTLSRLSRLNRESEYEMKGLEMHMTQLTKPNERDEYVNESRHPKEDCQWEMVGCAV